MKDDCPVDFFDPLTQSGSYIEHSQKHETIQGSMQKQQQT